MNVADLELDPNQLYLETPVELVETPESGQQSDEADRYEAVKQYLRQRGLFITDGEFLFYEAVLEQGDEVDARDFGGEIYLLRHTSATAVGELPELPQPSLE